MVPVAAHLAAQRARVGLREEREAVVGLAAQDLAASRVDVVVAAVEQRGRGRERRLVGRGFGVQSRRGRGRVRLARAPEFSPLAASGTKIVQRELQLARRRGVESARARRRPHQ